MHADRQTQTHIASHSQPDKMHTHAHTRGVNVKASTLQGHREPQIHLLPDSSPPLAAHTQNVVVECTHTVLCQKHTHIHTTLIHRVHILTRNTHTHTRNQTHGC